VLYIWWWSASGGDELLLLAVRFGRGNVRTFLMVIVSHAATGLRR
jgi:hypothetical protein